VGYLYGILAAALFAISQAAGKSAMQRLSLPATLAFRALAGFCFSLSFLGLPLTWPQDVHTVAWLAVSIALMPVAVNICYYIGLKQGGLGNQVALFQSVPVFALGTVCVLNRSLPGFPAILGCIVLLVGCAIVAGQAKEERRSWGMGLSSAAIAGVAIVVQKQVLTLMSREAMILAQNSVFLLLTGFAAGVLFRKERPGDVPAGHSSRRCAAGIALALLSGTLMLVGFDWLKYHTLESLGPVMTSGLLLLRLPFAQALGYVVFHHRPSPREFIGGGVVMIGALLLTCFGEGTG